MLVIAGVVALALLVSDLRDLPRALSPAARQGSARKI
jgi:hypothetical protein